LDGADTLINLVRKGAAGRARKVRAG